MVAAASHWWMKKPAWCSGLGVFLRMPGVAMRRNQFSEWFVIDQGKLSAIYSSMFYPDQDALTPNWPPYDGNWPVCRRRNSGGR